MENFSFYSPTFFEFGKDTEMQALEGINAFSEFLSSLGMPGNFEELGAREEDIPALVENLCFGNGREGSITGFVTLDKEDCTKIYQMMV